MGRSARLFVASFVSACGFHAATAPSDGMTGGDGRAPLDAVACPLDAGSATSACAPLPDDPCAIGVASTDDLVAAVAVAQPGQTITVAAGTYALMTTLVIGTPGVTLRSATGDASSVILDGGMVLGTVVTIDASNVSLVSITIAHSAGEGLEIQPTASAGLTGVRVYDVTFLDDAAEQIRIDASNVGGPYADDGEIGCSRLMKTTFPACPSGSVGVYANAARGWLVHDNQFSNVACTGFARAMWFRGGSRDTRVIGNRLLSSNMNITLGDDPTMPDARTYSDALPPTCSGFGSNAPQHWGGVLCNNAIAGLGVPSQASGDTFDDGLSLWGTCEAWALHNTVVSPAGSLTYHDIEFRFAGTYVHLVNNLLEQAPASRDGGAQDATYMTSSVTYGSTADFVDATGGDLHLTATAPEGNGMSIDGLGMCGSDADGISRLAAPRVGAYEN
jgi:hypothetical protein